VVLYRLGVVRAQLWPLPISLLVVVAILVILHHLVSNNRMKRMKNLHAAQETLLTSLGSLLLSARGLGPSVALLRSSWVFLASPVHSHRLLPLLFTPIAAVLCRLLASTTHPASSSSQWWCWVLGSCSFIRWGGGGGLPGVTAALC